jgi:uncharacterized membrane-anchored protein
MKDEAVNEFARNFLSIVAGVFTAIAVAFILLPLLNVAYNHFYESYFSTPPPDAWKKDLVMLVTMTGWLFISSLTGGFVCTIISIDKEQVYALISSLVCLAVLFVVSEGNTFEMGKWQSWILLISIPLGNLSGSGLGSAYKRRRKKP